MIEAKDGFSNEEIQAFMDLALAQANQATIQEQVPVGCVFVDSNGKVQAASHNLTNKYKNASRHCEINCIQAMTQSQTDISKLTLFVTVQPCIMCTYALNLVKIANVYFGQFNQRFGGCSSVMKASNFKFKGEVLRKFYQRGNLRIPEQMRNKSRKKLRKNDQ